MAKDSSSSDAFAALEVYVTSSGEMISTLENRSGVEYRSRLDWGNPQYVTVKSSSGGSPTSSLGN
ncbi:MAG: hypothetical protein IIB31_06675 [Chloroflexi bacterium]|nr:hypothetical protein [Chloroflexota bacterium]MCH8898788.1 hypothetical protein [Chloroflexota bacterium]